jgi:hypothetical protein
MIWNLTSQSCQFAGARRLFQPVEVYAVAGDVLNIQMHSSDFTPLFGIYDDQDKLLQSSLPAVAGTSSLSFPISQTGFYHIDATSTVDLQTGAFSLTVNCSASGCLYPKFLTQPSSLHVTYGTSPTVVADVSAVQQPRYDLYDAITGRPVGSFNAPNIKIPVVTGRSVYYIRASTTVRLKVEYFQLVREMGV